MNDRSGNEEKKAEKRWPRDHKQEEVADHAWSEDERDVRRKQDAVPNRMRESALSLVRAANPPCAKHNRGDIRNKGTPQPNDASRVHEVCVFPSNENKIDIRLTSALCPLTSETTASLG
jgi:hypothetical protein